MLRLLFNDNVTMPHCVQVPFPRLTSVRHGLATCRAKQGQRPHDTIHFNVAFYIRSFLFEKPHDVLFVYFVLLTVKRALVGGVASTGLGNALMLASCNILRDT